MRIATKIFGIIFAILLLLATVVMVLVNTESGTKLALQLVQHTIPGKLTVTRLEGKLSHHINMESLHYQHDNLNIHANKVKLRWRPLALLRKKIRIRELNMKELQLQTAPNATPLTVTEVKLDASINQEIVSGNLAGQLSVSHFSDQNTHFLLQARGKWQAYTLDLRLNSAHSHWHGAANGDLQQLVIQTRESQLFGGQLSINGSLNVAPKLAWHGVATGKQLNTANLSPNLSGPLNFEISSIINPQNHITLDAQADWNHATLTTKGTITEQWQLPFQLQIPDLSKFSHQMSGDFQLNGALNGPRLTPTLQLKYHSQKLSVSNNNIKNIKGLSSISVNLPESSITFKQMSFSADEAGEWRLSKATTLSYAPEIQLPTFTLKGPKKRQLSAMANWSESKGWDAKVVLTQLPLGWLGPMIFPQLEINGLSDIKLHLLMHESSQIGFKLILPAGTLQLPIQHRLEKFAYQGGSIIGKMTDSTSLDLDLRFINQSHLQGQIQLPKLRLETLDNKDQPLQGKLTWHIDNINFLAGLIPKVADTQGKLALNFDLSGKLTEPTVRGKAVLSDGSLRVPELNVSLTQLHINATGKGNEMHYHATAKAGPGTLDVSGSTNLSRSGFPTTLKISGKNALVANTPEIMLHAWPDLTLAINQSEQYERSLVTSGKLFVQSSKLTFEEFNQPTTLPDDVVIIEESDEQNVEWQMSSDIQLHLGDQIDLSAKGLTGKLQGDLHIKERPKQTTTAEGQLKVVNGKYNVAGTELTISRGNLVFTGGPITNPGLNIRATRSFGGPTNNASVFNDQKMVAGVSVTGTLSQPEIKLFTDPPSSQADSLAYLLTGQSVGQIKDSNNAQLVMQAASMLNFGGGPGKLSNLRNDLKHQFGLAELDIKARPEFDSSAGEVIQHTSLVLGKYLSPKLYLQYSFDILEHTPTLNIRYLLNKRWSIQSENSTAGTGVDLLYNIERK